MTQDAKFRKDCENITKWAQFAPITSLVNHVTCVYEANKSHRKGTMEL